MAHLVSHERDQVAGRLIGLGDQAALVADEFAALSSDDQTMLAAPSDSATRRERLVAEARAVAEAESVAHAANRALAEKKRALAEKSEAVMHAMAKGLQYVLGIMVLLTTVQLGAKEKSWRRGLAENLAKTATSMKLFKHVCSPARSELSTRANEWRTIILWLCSCDEGTTLLLYLLSHGSRVPENSLRTNLRNLAKSAECSAAKILELHQLIESHDESACSKRGVAAFNREFRRALTTARASPLGSPQPAAAGRSTRSASPDCRGTAVAMIPSPGGIKLGELGGRDERDDGDVDDGVREVADRLGSAIVALGDESASDARPEAGLEPSPVPVRTLRAELGVLALRSEADVRDLAGLVFDLFAENRAEKMLDAFGYELQALRAACRQAPERPRRQLVPHRRLSINTLAQLPGQRVVAAARATPADEHAADSEVAALTALLAATRGELDAAKAELAVARAEGQRLARKRPLPLAEVAGGGNAHAARRESHFRTCTHVLD